MLRQGAEDAEDVLCEIKCIVERFVRPPTGLRWPPLKDPPIVKAADIAAPSKDFVRADAQWAVRMLQPQ